MKIRRTDLAMEARELWQESAGETTRLAGVEAEEGLREGIPVTAVHILNQEGERALGKPQGNYVTLTMEGVANRAEDIFGRAVRAVAAELTQLLRGVPGNGLALVVGLGNREVTPDAIGPQVYGHTLATRHLVRQMPEAFGQLRPVAALAAEVLGSTGVESGEVVQAVCREIRPACVIAVDALASRRCERVCTTVQLSDTGIVPGSGVGNHRSALNQETLGVPVYAVGIPTVVDAATLAADLLEESGLTEVNPERLRQGQQTLMVTPRDIDQQVRDLSKVVGYGINWALQDLEIEEINALLS